MSPKKAAKATKVAKLPEFHLKILVTVDECGIPHCTPSHSKQVNLITWELGTDGYHFCGEGVSNLPAKYFGKNIKRDIITMKVTGDNNRQDCLYDIYVQGDKRRDKRQSGKAVIRNDPDR